jgi:hypothetical protein
VTSRQLAQVGLGLIGVWALLDALRMFAGIAFAGSDGPRGIDMLVVAVPLALLVGLSYVLVFRSSSLAAAIAPEGHTNSEHSAANISRTLVMLLGVMLLAQSVPTLINIGLAFLAAGEFPEGAPNSGLLRNFVGSGVQFAIALFLIIRPDRLLAFARRPHLEHAS